MPGPVVRHRKGGGLKRTGTTAGSSHPKASRLVARSQPSAPPVGATGPTKLSGRGKTYRQNRKVLAARLAAHYKSEFRGVPIGTGRKSDPAQQLSQEILSSQRARTTNRQAELGKITHPDMPHGLTAAIGDLIPDTPAEIALTAATGGAGKVVGAALKARKLAKAGEVVERAAKVPTPTKAVPRAEKAAETARLNKAANPSEGFKVRAGERRAAGRGTPERRTSVREKVANRPRPVQAAKAKVAETKPARAVKRTTGRVVAKTPKPVRVTVRTGAKPFKLARRHPIATTALSVEGPGAVGAATSGNHNIGAHLTAPVVGTAKALLHPKKTGATTLHTLPGLVTVPVGMAAGAGLSAYRAGTTAAGLKHYSGTEITSPTTKNLDAVKNFAKEYANVYGSGDAKRIEKATENEFGVGQLLPLVGALRHRAVRSGHMIEHPEAGMGRIKPIRTRRIRKQAARENSRGDRAASVKGMAPGDALDKVLGISGRKKHVKGDAHHLVAAMAKEGATTVEHLKEAAKARGTGHHAAAAKGTLTHHDIAEIARKNPEAVKAAEAALKIVREEQPKIHTSDVKVSESQRVTAGIKHPWEREGWKKNPKTPEQRATNAKLEADATRETEAWAKRTGRVAPVYVKSVDATVPHVNQNVNAVPRGTVGRTSHKMDYRSEAKLNKQGLEDLSYESFKVNSLFEPRAKRELNAAVAQGIEGHAETFPVLTKEGKVRAGGAKDSKVLTKRQRDSWVRQEQAAGRDPDRIMWIDAQTGKAATISEERMGRSVEIPYGEESAARAFHRLGEERKAGISKGPAYVGVERTWGNEFLAQHGKLTETNLQKIGQGLLPTQRAASKLLLGYSPSWLLAQPVAEGAQALAAVGPINMYKGLKRYKAMTPDQKREFDAGIGATAGTGSVYEALTDVREGKFDKQGRGAIGQATTGLRNTLRKSRPGRLVEGLLTTRYANGIDRRKGLAIRRAVAAGHLEREYNSFTAGLRGFSRQQTRLDREMRDLTPQQRIEWVTKNPKQLAKLEGYVDDVMGNWSALTTNERAAAGLVVFYPFVRMSAEWSVLTFPARHPLKAAALQFLSQENAKQLENLLGGKPSFFTQWATVPLYSGKNGEASGLLPLQRIAPGSNALVEAAGGDAGPRDALRAVNPFLAAGAAALGAYDPQSGRNLLDKYQKPTLGQFGKSFAGSVVALPSIVRVADQILTGGKTLDKLRGKPGTPTSKIYDMLGGDKVFRSLIPFVPSKTSKERQKAEIGRLLQRKYAADQYDFFRDIRPAVIEATKGGKDPRGSQAEQMLITYLDGLVAQNQLNKLYERYGIRPQKDLTGRASDLAGGISDTTIPGHWNDILEKAQKGGLPIRRVKQLRRARARRIMGNQ